MLSTEVPVLIAPNAFCGVWICSLSRSKWLQSAAFRMPSLRFAPRAPHRFSGFTLVELMVVFAILALVMALAPASLGRMYETA